MQKAAEAKLTKNIVGVYEKRELNGKRVLEIFKRLSSNLQLEYLSVHTCDGST